MIDWHSVQELSFPNFSDDILSHKNAVEAVAKANAYFKLALFESPVSYEEDMTAAQVTDAVHELKTDCSAKEYLELCLQEVAYAEGQLEEDSINRDELQYFREAIERRIN